MWILNSREITYEQNHFVHKSLWNGNPMIAWGEKQDRITFRNNLVYDWQYPVGKPDTHYFVGNWNANVTNGIHENNTIAKDGRVFLDPERTVMTHLGEPDIDTVSSVLWNRTKDNWDPSIGALSTAAHVIAGFQVVNPNPDPLPEPEPTPTPDPDPTPDPVIHLTIVISSSQAKEIADAIQNLADAVSGLLSTQEPNP
jgi:hypothetical protein